MTRRLPITDGLRAIAVLAVVLFHVFPDTFRGGYIGVDVFFVISGFVIAHRYLPALTSGEVRFRDFFFRRIQRLVPAYLVLLVVVTIFACLLLAPMDLSNYGKSLAGQAAYLQNFVFWRGSEYFDQAQSKPLLHTWSLAVEEQFYLFFPLLVLLFRRNRGLAVALLALAFLGSLGLGFVLANISPKTAFYLLPTRAWEFAAGIGVALAFGRFSAKRLSTPLLVAGIAMVVWAAVGFDKKNLFPGLQALLAVSGTALVCLVQKEAAPLSASLLTNRVAQHFGRISYSWYLWHWPIIVFFYARFDRMPNLWEGLGCLVMGYLLGAASFRFIEQPGLRFDALRLPRPSLALLGSFLLFALVAGSSLVVTRGALNRYPPEQAVLYAAEMDRVPYRCPLMARAALLDTQVCRLVDGTGPAVLLHGDSHADRAKVALQRMAAETGVPLYLTQRNCKLTDYGKNRNCSEKTWDQLAADIRRFHITKVVVISYWKTRMTEADYRAGVRRLLDTGVTVYLQKVAPNGPFFDPVLRAKGIAPSASYTVDDYNREHAVQNKAFAALQREFGPRLHVLDPVPLICPTGPCDFATGANPNYLDTNHLNSVGLARVVSMFDEVFPKAPKVASR